MTRITRDQFKNDFQNGLDINNLSPETKAAFEKAGVTEQKLVEIAHGDAQIKGDKELAELFKVVDSFDKNGSDQSFETGGNQNASTVSGQLYEALKSQLDQNVVKAQMRGAQPSNPKVPDDALNHASRIVQDKNLSLDQKKEQLQKCLENVKTSDELKALLVGSKTWAKEEKAILLSALGKSEIAMKQIGKEFSLNDQYEVLEQISTSENLSQKEKGIALGNMFKNTSQNKLNKIAEKYPAHVALVMARFSPEVRDRFSELGPDLRKKVLLETAAWATSNEISNLLSEIPRDSRAELIQSFSPDEKNRLMIGLQRNGLVPEFLKTLPGVDLDEVLLGGLTRDNAEFIKLAFQHLKEFAPDKNQAEIYDANILHLEGWIRTQYQQNP